MSAKYYGGSKVTSSLRELEAKDFADLVSRLSSSPHHIPITRQEYQLLPKDGRGGQSEVKDGPWICSVAFKDGETRRCDANARSIVLVCLDIDDPDLARPFTESPEALVDALWPFSFLAWRTTSATPEKPRLRIMVEVEEILFDTIPKGQELLARLVRFVAVHLLGLPKKWAGSRESQVLSQPAYRPAVFKDETEPPVIASRPNGKAIQLLDIPNEIEEEIADSFAYHGETDPDMDLSHLPVPGLSVEDLREPLFAISPDVDYLTWTRVLTAFRHQFRSEEPAREAFFLADEWCRSGSKYKEGDTEEKWKSFKPDSPGKTPVTIRTFFKIAADHGWKNTRLANKLRQEFTAWLKQCEEREDSETMMNEGPAVIAAQPFKNAMVEQAMVSELRKALHRLKVHVKDLAIVRDISKARAIKRREEDNGNLPAWLRSWCYVRTLDRWYNIITGIQLAPEAFNRSFMVELMPGDKDEEAAKGGRPSIMPCDYALNIKGKVVRQVDGIVYDPRWQGEEPFFAKEGVTYVNTYLASALPAMDAKGSAAAGKTLNRHLKRIIREHLYRQILLDWMAFIVQNPGRKIRWVPVIQGAQGCGKTLLLNILGGAIGDRNIKLTNPGATKSDFNDWALGAQVVGIEEIRVKGLNRDEVMNKLKDVTANDRVALNRKHNDVVTVDNVTNYIAFTNYHDALFLSEDDRRYFVLKCRIQSKKQKEDLAAERVNGVPYFIALAELVGKGGAVRHYLMNRKIAAGFDPDGDAPDTCYRRQMIAESKNPLQLAIEELIACGEYPMIGPDLILYEDLQNRTLGLSGRDKRNHEPSHYLYMLGYQPHNGGERHKVTGSRSQVWVHAENYLHDLMGDPVAELRRRYDDISDEIL